MFNPRSTELFETASFLWNGELDEDKNVQIT
jgi:hypothetical protein